jgi:hypothetical protein
LNSLVETDDPYDDRYGLLYSVYGAALDVDALLAASRPRGEFSIWHKGDGEGRPRPTATSGVQIDVIETGVRAEVAPAILRFLEEERAFLKQAALFTGPSIWSMLSCRMWIYAKVPSGIWLEPPVLQALAALGIGWEVTGYPCADRDGP